MTFQKRSTPHFSSAVGTQRHTTGFLGNFGVHLHCYITCKPPKGSTWCWIGWGTSCWRTCSCRNSVTGSGRGDRATIPAITTENHNKDHGNQDHFLAFKMYDNFSELPRRDSWVDTKPNPTRPWKVWKSLAIDIPASIWPRPQKLLLRASIHSKIETTEREHYQILIELK